MPFACAAPGAAPAARAPTATNPTNLPVSARRCIIATFLVVRDALGTRGPRRSCAERGSLSPAHTRRTNTSTGSPRAADSRRSCSDPIASPLRRPPSWPRPAPARSWASRLPTGWTTAPHPSRRERPASASRRVRLPWLPFRPLQRPLRLRRALHLPLPLPRGARPRPSTRPAPAGRSAPTAHSVRTGRSAPMGHSAPTARACRTAGISPAARAFPSAPTGHSARTGRWAPTGRSVPTGHSVSRAPAAPAEENAWRGARRPRVRTPGRSCG
jgi:hypothetical protein